MIGASGQIRTVGRRFTKLSADIPKGLHRIGWINPVDSSVLVFVAGAPFADTDLFGLNSGPEL